MTAAQLISPFGTINELAQSFFVSKNDSGKKWNFFHSFTKAAVNEKTLNKLDSVITQLDEELIIPIKEKECDFSGKRQLQWIEEGKFLLKLIEALESLVDTIDGDKDEISQEISKKLIVIGNKVAEVITLAELYNETAEKRKEISNGKTLTIDEAFSI